MTRAMTIEELIRILQTYPQDTRVVVDGYEGGYDDISPERISVTKIQLDVGTEEWEGLHEEPALRRKGSPRSGAIVDALVFHRASN